MTAITLPSGVLSQPTSLLSSRVDRLGGYSYKLDDSSSQFGLDVILPEGMDMDEGSMSVWIPFADGKRRDGVGDLLEVGGIRTERHQMNPVVLFDHGKQVTLPVGLAEDRKTKAYTVALDPVSQMGKVNAFFYQGDGMVGIDKVKEYDHAIFCQQIYDLMCKRLLRAGSIGYQVISARELPPDYERGTPKGLHLLSTLMLEASVVVMPANMDTVRKMLCMSTICGKPKSPMLIKSLTTHSRPKKVQLGWEPRKDGLCFGQKSLITFPDEIKINGIFKSYMASQDGEQHVLIHGEDGQSYQVPEKWVKAMGKSVKSIRMQYRKKGGATPRFENVSNFQIGDKVVARAYLTAPPGPGKPVEMFAKTGDRMIVVALTPSGGVEVERTDGKRARFSTAEVRKVKSLHLGKTDTKDTPRLDPESLRRYLTNKFGSVNRDAIDSYVDDTVRHYGQNVWSERYAGHEINEIFEHFRTFLENMWHEGDRRKVKKSLHGLSKSNGDKVSRDKISEQSVERALNQKYPGKQNVIKEILGQYIEGHWGTFPSMSHAVREVESDHGNDLRGSKSLEDTRKKYRPTKALRRRLKKSSPGSSIIYCRKKDLEKVEKAAKGKGVKFERVGSGRDSEKIKLTGDDQAIDEVAKEFGLPMSGVKSLQGDKKMALKKKTKGMDQIPPDDELHDDLSEADMTGDKDMDPGLDENLEMDMEEDEHANEPFGAQVLRRLHQDKMVLLEEYDEMMGPLENEVVKQMLVKEIEELDNIMSSIEATFKKVYEEGQGLKGLDGAMNEGEEELDEVADDKEGEELETTEEEVEDKDFDDAVPADSEEDEEPTPEEAFEGSTKFIDLKKIKSLRKTVQSKRYRKNLGIKKRKDIDPQQEMDDMEHGAEEAVADDMGSEEKALDDGEKDKLKEVAGFMKELADGGDFSDETRMKAYHYHKTVEPMGTPMDGVDGEEKDMMGGMGDIGEMSMSPRKAISHVHKYLKELASSHEFTDDMKEKAMQFHKALDEITNKPEDDKGIPGDKEWVDEEAEEEEHQPGEMGEKSIKRMLSVSKKQSQELDELNRKLQRISL